MMKINRFLIAMSTLFLSTLYSSQQNATVTSVLPAHKIQKRANPSGICTPYSDNNYYLYEGEAAIFYPHTEGLWATTLATYDSKLLRAYQAMRFQNDTTVPVSGYYLSSVCEGIVLEGIKAGTTPVTFTLEWSGGRQEKVGPLSVVVLDLQDDRLEKMDKGAFFTAIEQDNVQSFQLLLQRGISLTAMNENNQTVIEVLAQSGSADLIEILAKYLRVNDNYPMLMQLLHAVVAQQNQFATALTLQYIPLNSLKTLDTDGSIQTYAVQNVVTWALRGDIKAPPQRFNGTITGNQRVALHLIAQGYPLVSTLIKLQNGSLSNALLLATVYGYQDIVLECIKTYTSAQLAMVDPVTGCTPLIIALMGCHIGSVDAPIYETIVEHLIAKMNPQDIAIKDKQGNTAVYYAAQADNLKMVKLVQKYMPQLVVFSPQDIINSIQGFLQSGEQRDLAWRQASYFIPIISNLGVQDAQGNTALMLAIQQRNEWVANLLAHHVPFPVLVMVNRKNQSALQLAEMQGGTDESLLNMISSRIEKEEKNYFYDGIESTCSNAVYIPRLDNQGGILGVSSCVTGSADGKSKAQEIVVEPASYVYNAGGKIQVLNHKVEGVLYTPRPLNEIYGAKNMQAVVELAYQYKWEYIASTAVLSLSDKEFAAIDTQGKLKKYIQKIGYAAATSYQDPHLAAMLMKRNYIVNVTVAPPAATAKPRQPTRDQRVFPRPYLNLAQLRAEEIERIRQEEQMWRQRWNSWYELLIQQESWWRWRRRW